MQPAAGRREHEDAVDAQVIHDVAAMEPAAGRREHPARRPGLSSPAGRCNGARRWTAGAPRQRAALGRGERQAAMEPAAERQGHAVARVRGRHADRAAMEPATGRREHAVIADQDLVQGLAAMEPAAGRREHAARSMSWSLTIRCRNGARRRTAGARGSRTRIWQPQWSPSLRSRSTLSSLLVAEGLHRTAMEPAV
jgi:hypothetical protein